MSEIQQYDPAAIEKVRSMLQEGNPQFWNFEEDGDEVIGYAVRKEVGQTSEGPVEIFVLDVQGTLRSVWLFHTALINKLRRLRPQVGDLVGIKYLGKRQPQQAGGRPYYDYQVVALGQKGASLDWGDDGAPRALTPAPHEEVADGEVVDEAPPPGASSSGTWQTSGEF